MFDAIEYFCNGPKILKMKRTADAKEFPLPEPAKYGDVGIDLPAVFPLDEYGNRPGIIIQPQSRALIPTGIQIEIPFSHWASIEARSSTSKKMIIVPKGVIDPGYRGELFAQLINVGTEPVTINHGDRYIQLIIHKREVMDFTIIECDELSETERGDTGFGSSGQSAVAK